MKNYKFRTTHQRKEKKETKATKSREEKKTHNCLNKQLIGYLQILNTFRRRNE